MSNLSKNLLLISLIVHAISQLNCIDYVQSSNKKITNDDIWAFITDINLLEIKLNKSNYENIYKKLNTQAKYIFKHCTKEQWQTIINHSRSVIEQIKKFRSLDEENLENKLLSNKPMQVDLAAIERDALRRKKERKESDQEIFTNNFLDFLHGAKTEIEDYIELLKFIESPKFPNFQKHMEKNASNNLLDESFELEHLKYIFKPKNIRTLLFNFKQTYNSYMAQKNSDPKLQISEHLLRTIQFMALEIIELMEEVRKKNNIMNQVKFKLSLD